MVQAKPASWSRLLAEAIEHQRSGRFRQAEAVYRQVLRQEPDNANANHMLGLLAHQAGDNGAAVTRIGKAIAANPRSALYRFNLGIVLAASGEDDAAIESYREALALKPDYAAAHNNLGLLLDKLERTDEAAACFEQATRIAPDHVEAWVNLGKALRGQAKPAEAVTCFERALKLDPTLAPAHFGIGNSLEDQEKWTEAEACYRRALASNADYREAQNNLGTVLLAQGRYGEAQAVFHRLLEMKHGPIRATPGALEDERPIGGEAPRDKQPIPWSRFVDRVEQLEYVLAKELIDPSFGDTVARFRGVLDEFGGDGGNNGNGSGGGKGAITVPSDLARGIENFCDSFIHYVDAPAVPSGAVNDRLDFNAIENEFLSSPSPVVCLDDFLGPEALRELRRFCLEATIFFGSDAAGFVSSNVTNGFNCSLLYQIAEGLKRHLPRVIGSQFLTNMWVYRHRARGKGVHAHTDAGAVTFNFWISPDTANVDPGRGGLVVYKKEQPLDWDWMEYNKRKNAPDIQQRIKTFLETADAITIPYRENRALMFRSNLFHKSDEFHFKEGFENQRINISMLFGERAAARPAGPGQD